MKSGKLKDAGNPFREMTPGDRAYWQELIDQVHRQFIRRWPRDATSPRRRCEKFADGRVLTGEQAIELGLVDELGNFHDAVDLAKEQAEIKGEPRLVYPPDDRARFLEELLRRRRPEAWPRRWPRPCAPRCTARPPRRKGRASTSWRARTEGGKRGEAALGAVADGVHRRAAKRDGCIFCDFPAEEGEEADRRNLIVHRSAHAFTILNRFPYNSGHVMVVPRAHVARLEDLAGGGLRRPQRGAAAARWRCSGPPTGRRASTSA